MSKEEILLKELTRLLLHIAPEAEPANDVVDVYWQVDNAVCGLLKERHDGALVVRDSSGVVTCSVCGTGLGAE